MHNIETKLTKLLNLKTPILSAPMYYASTPEMAAEVSEFGGLGFIAAGFSSSNQLKQELRTIRTRLKIPDGLPIPVGVGFIGWIMDMTEPSDDPRITTVLNELPAAVWFAFGDNLGEYISRVREYDAKRSHKTLIFMMVHTVEHALRAANEWKVDVLVAQGREAGGHMHSNAPPTFNLLPAIRFAVPNGPLILATGGIVTGGQIAAALAMGADGAVVGTRFLFTDECMYSKQAKNVLVKAGFNSTSCGTLYDDVNRTAFWPEGYHGRGIANKIADDYKEGCDLEERLKRYDQSKSEGKDDRLVIWAGEGVAYVNEIKTTREVIETLHADTVAALTAGYKLIN